MPDLVTLDSPRTSNHNVMQGTNALLIKRIRSMEMQPLLDEIKLHGSILLKRDTPLDKLVDSITFLEVAANTQIGNNYLLGTLQPIVEQLTKLVYTGGSGVKEEAIRILTQLHNDTPPNLKKYTAQFILCAMENTDGNIQYFKNQNSLQKLYDVPPHDYSGLIKDCLKSVFKSPVTTKDYTNINDLCSKFSKIYLTRDNDESKINPFMQLYYEDRSGLYYYRNNQFIDIKDLNQKLSTHSKNLLTNSLNAPEIAKEIQEISCEFQSCNEDVRHKVIQHLCKLAFCAEIDVREAAGAKLLELYESSSSPDKKKFAIFILKRMIAEDQNLLYYQLNNKLPKTFVPGPSKDLCRLLRDAVTLCRSNRNISIDSAKLYYNILNIYLHNLEKSSRFERIDMDTKSDRKHNVDDWQTSVDGDNSDNLTKKFITEGTVRTRSDSKPKSLKRFFRRF